MSQAAAETHGAANTAAKTGERKTIHIVLHEAKDTVGVAVVEGIQAGTQLNAWIMDEDEIVTVAAKQDIPIGHKVALKDMAVATRCSSTAWISARWWRRSARASTPMYTTSRRNAGKPRACQSVEKHFASPISRETP